MQFLVIAYDGTDSEAPSRRQAVRDRHLAGWRRLVADGHGITGGAILDDDGRMIGSAAMVSFDSRADLDRWLSADPYVTGGVWTDIQVRPFRVAPSA